MKHGREREGGGGRDRKGERGRERGLGDFISHLQSTKSALFSCAMTDTN